MRKLVVFNYVSLDGYFTDANGDMSWAKSDDAESRAFAESNASAGGELLFGRRTYELMASYWPTPMAQARNPVVAERMNSLPKVVFSRTLDHAGWKNTRVAKGEPAGEIRRMKQGSGSGMAILGSGSIVAQLAQEGLIDEYQLMVTPIILGKGKPLFEGVERRLKLRLTNTRRFANGNVLLCYEPAA
jgi:dihydrofolate reductase